MTNLDIIKYLAHYNPTHLANFLNKICYDAWNLGRLHRERPITDWEEWLQSDPKTTWYFSPNELEAWSKGIKDESKVLCKTEISEILIKGKPYYPYTVYRPMGSGGIGSFGRKDTYNEAIDIVCADLQNLKMEATYINDDGNLTVTIPIKDSADHMWNNNNEYDYEV